MPFQIGFSNLLCKLMPSTLSQLSIPLAAQLHGNDVVFTSISTDSRNCPRGALFVALRGPHYDGHQFIDAAYHRGACAVVAEHPHAILPTLQVSDCHQAYARLASLHRLSWPGRLLAITGSNGKTTIKELIAAMLRTIGTTHATWRNHNNAIGVAHTLLALEAQHQFAVVETGTSAVGEIAHAAALAKPRIAVLSNITSAHLAGFGDLDAIAAEKMRLIDATDVNGTLILNRDDRYFPQWQKRAAQRRIIDYALDDARAQFYAVKIQINARNSRVTLRCPQVQEPQTITKDREQCTTSQIDSGIISQSSQLVEFSLPLAGRHNVANALAALAAVYALGYHPVKTVGALAQVDPVPGRMEIQQRGHFTLIHDCYNANPGSLRAAIDYLATLNAGKRILVLGEMKELGLQSQAAHCTAGKWAREARLEGLFTVGKDAALALEGITPDAWHQAFVDQSALQAYLPRFLQRRTQENIVLLLKASREARMESVIEKLGRR